MLWPKKKACKSTAQHRFRSHWLQLGRLSCWGLKYYIRWSPSARASVFVNTVPWCRAQISCCRQSTNRSIGRATGCISQDDWVRLRVQQRRVCCCSWYGSAGSLLHSAQASVNGKEREEGQRFDKANAGWDASHTHQKFILRVSCNKWERRQEEANRQQDTAKVKQKHRQAMQEWSPEDWEHIKKKQAGGPALERRCQMLDNLVWCCTGSWLSIWTHKISWAS